MRIGRYEASRVLGHGGGGVVYAAELPLPGGERRAVALKVLHSGSDSIRREARIGGLLRHRNLVDVFEIGESDGTWFCAMELCDGAVAAHAPLPPRAVVDVGLQVCAALQYAHEELGLIHLDLKPQNLLLDGAVVKVADLGIAAAEGFGGTEARRGTRGYMAPEQAFGGEVDVRADVYGLARTLVDLATGEGPDAASTLDMSVLESADPVSGVPDWLAPAVDGALSDDPADRPPDMAAFAALLRSLDVSGPGLAEALGRSEVVRLPSIAGQADRFVGRHKERSELVGMLDHPGAIGLKGPPGIGKSRLAVVAVREWRGPAWRVELADARHVRDVCLAVGRQLGLRLGADPVDAVGGELKRRGELVLILDNADGVDAIGNLARKWSEHASDARILVTARAATGCDREVILGPLDPDASADLLVARAAERGAAIAGDPDIEALVARLDHIPLAIELAAGRIGVLSVADVLDRMGLSLLRRATDDRHGTLTAAIDWSWSLLSRVEREALGDLTVFSESFSLAAARHVLDLTHAEALDVLSALVDRSMLRVLDGGRFGMLSTIAEFVSRHPVDPAAAIRHGRWFARIAVGSMRPADRQRLLRDLPNLLVASRRALERGDAQVAAPCALRVWRLLSMTGPYGDIGQLALRVARMPGLDPEDVAQLLDGAAVSAYRGGDIDGGLALMQQAIETARDNPWRAARSKVNLGGMYADLGRIDEALAAYDTALVVLRAEGDEAAVGALLTNAAVLYNEAGHVDRARDSLTEALALIRRRGDPVSEAVILQNLGSIEFRANRIDESRALHAQSLGLARETGNRRAEALGWVRDGIFRRFDADLVQAAASFERAASVARSVGDASLESIGLGNLGHVHRDAGRTDEARASYRRALERAREGQGRFQGHWLGQLVAIELPDDGREQLDQARALLEGFSDRALMGWHHTARAEFHARRGERAEARAALARAGEPAPDPDLRLEIARVAAILGPAPPTGEGGASS